MSEYIYPSLRRIRGVRPYQPRCKMRAIYLYLCGNDGSEDVDTCDLPVLGMQATTFDIWRCRIKRGETAAEPNSWHPRDLRAAGYWLCVSSSQSVEHELIVWSEESQEALSLRDWKDNYCEDVISGLASFKDDWWAGKIKRMAADMAKRETLARTKADDFSKGIKSKPESGPRPG